MTLENARDIALIVQAVLSITLLLVLLIVAIGLYKKVDALLTSAKGTMNNLQGTAAFLTETTVSPVIKFMSTLAGVRASAKKAADMVAHKQGGNDEQARK